MKQLLLSIIATLVFASCAPYLHKAVKDGNAEKVRKLLDAGADVNGRNSSKAVKLLRGGTPLQYTPLHWAAYLGDWEIAEILIYFGAEVNAEDPWYSTPLYLAAEQAHLDFVRKLIAEGADVNVRSSMWGYTPLHRAAWGSVVKRFGAGTSSEADLNENYLEIVGILLEKGAEVNVWDNNGETPLDHAIDSGTEEIVALLRKYGAKTHRELKEAGVVPGVKMRDYQVGAVKIRFRASELSNERKEEPWNGYGVDGGHPDTVIHSLDVSDESGTYSVPAELINDLGNPNIEHVRARQTGNLLDLSMTNSDGAGGHHVLFQVNTSDYKVRRFVRMVIEDDMQKTHDWMPLKKRRASWKKTDE